MAKNAKKPPVHNGKPITAFFAPRSSLGTSSQDASRSSGKQAAKTTSSPAAPDNAMQLVATPEHSILKDSRKSPIKPDAIVDPSKVSSNSPRRSERNQSSFGSLMPPVAVASLKRLRSPSLLAATAMPEPVASDNCDVLSIEARKSKFDSNSEMEQTGNVIYVNSTPNPKSKKRPRLLTVEGPKTSEPSDMIPSSQSDEQELSIENTTNAPELVADVDNVSRNTSWSITPERNMDNNDMEIDKELSGFSPMTTPPTDGWLSSQHGSQSSDPGTPPPSGPSSLPPTPVALDRASKTAQIIAEIKAKAYATATSSPEPVTLELDDHTDTSSDEEQDIFPMLLQPKIVPSASRLDAPANDFGTTQQTNRYTFRKRSPSPSRPSRPRIASSRAAMKVAPQKTTTRLPSGRKPPDPFAALLKEKRASQKHGESDAFTRAELQNQNLGKSGLTEELDEDEDEALDIQSEDIAKAVVENPDAFADEFEKIQIPTGRKGKEIVDSAQDEDRKTLFGAKNGGVILDILKQDKAMKQYDESSEKTSGIQFWSSSPTSSNVSLATKDIPSFCLFGSSALIQLFNICLRRADLSRSATLLNSNFISSLEISDRASVISDLCDLAFLFPPAPDLLRNAAVNALEEFWNSNNEPRANTLLFSRILNIVEALGAEPSIITEHHWVVLDVQQYTNVTMSSRELFLSQLIGLLAACARSKRLQADDTSDIVIILLLMGMDMSISTNLARDITLAIDSVCRYNLQTDSNNLETEMHLCFRILRFAQAYTPINRSRLVSLLSDGSSAMRRIANIVAYGVITDKQSLDKENYSDAPPLAEVIDQLIPYSRSSTLPPGKFALHPNTDYVDLGFYITILGVAVSNLRNYVVQERRALAARNLTATTVGSPRKITEKLKPDLELLHAALEKLHSNILDTRATHLERSRTKAAIKGLAMNIHYQREHWIKNGPDARSKTLAEYFQKKPKP